MCNNRICIFSAWICQCNNNNAKEMLMPTDYVKVMQLFLIFHLINWFDCIEIRFCMPIDTYVFIYVYIIILEFVQRLHYCFQNKQKNEEYSFLPLYNEYLCLTNFLFQINWLLRNGKHCCFHILLSISLNRRSMWPKYLIE